jgi:hypothetical protein
MSRHRHSLVALGIFALAILSFWYWATTARLYVSQPTIAGPVATTDFVGVPDGVKSIRSALSVRGRLANSGVLKLTLYYVNEGAIEELCSWHIGRGSRISVLPSEEAIIEVAIVDQTAEDGSVNSFLTFRSGQTGAAGGCFPISHEPITNRFEELLEGRVRSSETIRYIVGDNPLPRERIPDTISTKSAWREIPGKYLVIAASLQ